MLMMVCKAMLSDRLSKYRSQLQQGNDASDAYSAPAPAPAQGTPLVLARPPSTMIGRYQ